MSIHLIYDPAYLKHETGVHPENALRLEAIRRAIREDEELSKKNRQRHAETRLGRGHRTVS